MPLSGKDIQAIRQRREQQGRKGLRRVPPKPRYPHAIERQYNKDIQMYIALYIGIVESRLFPRLDLIQREAELVLDRLDNYASDIDQVMNEVDQTFEGEAPDMDKVIMETALQIDQRNKEEFDRQTLAVLGVVLAGRANFLQDQMTSFRLQNKTLLKSIITQGSDQIQGIVQRGISQGVPLNELRSQVKERFSMMQNRGKLIARDQVSTFNGVLTELRQKEAGVKSFVWVTAQDDRVRAQHSQWGGKTFEWDNPPGGQMPGQAVGCRCIASPVMEDILTQVQEVS